MALKEQLQEDMRGAMRSGDHVRRDALRLAIAALHNAEIAAGKPFEDDADVTGVLAREAKQRRESIEEYRKAGRDDLAAKEEAELAVLSGYLPDQASREEILEAARKAIAETGATGPRDIGKVMPLLVQEFRGRAEGREINDAVREILSG
jgi:uncharacterized protein YqeY